MLSIYQKQKHDGFYLWLGLTYKLIHTMTGADMGERFHRDIRHRIMHIGKRFPSFTFTFFEIDEPLAGGKIFEFYDSFIQCAEANSTS